MTFTKTTSFEDIEGTGYRGEITATYDELVAVFGEPTPGPDRKSKAEWGLIFDDGTVATIYDWKFYDLQPEQVTTWSIGGKSNDAVEHVLLAMVG